MNDIKQKNNMHYTIQYFLTTLVILMLATYPLVGGMEIHNAHVILQTLAIITLTTFFVSVRHYGFLGKAQWLLVLLLVITPILYLIPLPTLLWEHIPGREIYVQLAYWLDGRELAYTNKTLSIVPYQTEFALFALLPPLAIFLVTVYLPSNLIRIILYVAIGITIGEAILAVIQFGKSDDYFYFGIPRIREDSAHGTFLNPDHFATLMAIMLPFMIAMLTYILRAKKQLDFENSKTLAFSIIFLLFILLVFIAAFFSGSRAGIILTLLSGIIAYTAFTQDSNRRAKLIITGIIAISFIGILSLTNISSVIDRFTVNNPFIDGRWTIFSNAFSGIVDFFPFGSGPGTFPDVYRIYQPVDQRGFINHTHNDYLELLFDTGLFGLIGIITFLTLFTKQWANVVNPRRATFKYMQTAAGIGIIIFLINALIEFNLHDAINVLFFSLLTGIYFHKPEHRKRSKRLRH